MTILEASHVIRDNVSAQEIAARYGYQPNRGGYIPCPFHAEKTASLKLHKSGWYCYGCGKGGSVIDFVMLHESYSFTQAVKAIDENMHLGLLNVKGIYLTESMRRDKRQADFDKVKEQFKRAINAAIRVAEGRLMRHWRVYQDACSTPARERTGAQWDAIHNEREWCLYYEDIIAELRKQYEEVIAWRMSPQNRHSA